MDEDLAGALTRLESARAEALQAVDATTSTTELDAARVQYTGKKSSLSQVTGVMGRLDAEQRKTLGAAVNAAKTEIETAITQRQAELARREQEQRFEAERLDVTLSGTPFPDGYRHPLLATVRGILEILARMGYDVYEGPDVEWERYNFDMLNTPEHHPARDVQDTFWVGTDMVLRTQTSPAQIR